HRGDCERHRDVGIVDIQPKIEGDCCIAQVAQRQHTFPHMANNEGLRECKKKQFTGKVYSPILVSITWNQLVDSFTATCKVRSARPSRKSSWCGLRHIRITCTYCGRWRMGISWMPI